ncbi:MAG: hypothetical protein DRR42_01690 [Gammaproteobacteria bacterium]|nr:MAG: hypothetical protein DRR42_01690 [Gammaproteobacteria bacterium]
MLIVACGDEPAVEATSSSPLLGADPDRLWILARASRVGDGKRCRDLYLAPEDPRYQELVKRCDSWTRDYADYLRINGFPTIEHQHLKDPAYWNWYIDKRQSQLDCVSALGTPAVTVRGAAREGHRRHKNECDPYDNALINLKRTPTDLGIRYQ